MNNDAYHRHQRMDRIVNLVKSSANKDGYCSRKNKEFSEILDVSRSTIITDLRFIVDGKRLWRVSKSKYLTQKKSCFPKHDSLSSRHLVHPENIEKYFNFLEMGDYGSHYASAFFVRDFALDYFPDASDYVFKCRSAGELLSNYKGFSLYLKKERENRKKSPLSRFLNRRITRVVKRSLSSEK